MTEAIQGYISQITDYNWIKEKLEMLSYFQHLASKLDRRLGALELEAST